MSADSGTHRSHGLHFLALTDEKGSADPDIRHPARPPPRHHCGRPRPHLLHLRAAGLGPLADLGFRGLDNDVCDPVIVTGVGGAVSGHREGRRPW
ncbi:hypothetical protein [Streptomyces acidicola]|uniref:hypothetical protein n=1 Tax=Streptomyces acidicola TaxID=2596892 RepID=UPI0034133420